jgi:hypothetical protein
VAAAPLDEVVEMADPVPEAVVAVGAEVMTEFEPGFVAVTVTCAARLEAVAWL